MVGRHSGEALGRIIVRGEWIEEESERREQRERLHRDGVKRHRINQPLAVIAEIHIARRKARSPAPERHVDVSLGRGAW